MNFVVKRLYKNKKYGMKESNSIWEIFGFIYHNIFPTNFNGEIGDLKGVIYEITVNKAQK